MEKYNIDNQSGEPVVFYKKGKSIIFDYEAELEGNLSSELRVKMSTDQMKKYSNELFGLAKSIWPNLTLKDVTGMGNDYGEYYDREYDNDGGSGLNGSGITFSPPAWHLGYNRLYRFTRIKMETYLYDLIKIVEKMNNENLKDKVNSDTIKSTEGSEKV